VRRLDGRALPGRDLPGSLVVMGEDEGHPRAFMTYSNYRAILAYNCSNYYAIAVGTLSDEVAK
jgi:membrane-bound lytic murein transglycosylase B